MNKVFILFCKTDNGNSIVRVFKNESDAIDEELFLSDEHPEYQYFVKGYDVE